MRPFDYDFQIDNVPILAADEGVQIQEKDLIADDSGKDESGVEHQKVLREKLMTIQLSYFYLTRSELLYMRNLIKGKSTFQVTLLDLDGQRREIRAKCPNLSHSVFNSVMGVYKKAKFTIIQC